MRIYVAGASTLAHLARDAMDAARERGHEITHDWTQGLALRSYGCDRELTSRDAQAVYEACRDGIEGADAVLMLAPPPSHPTIGAWIELGIADALEKILAIVGPGHRDSALAWRATSFEGVRDALEWLEGEHESQPPRDRR